MRKVILAASVVLFASAVSGFGSLGFSQDKVAIIQLSGNIGGSNGVLSDEGLKPSEVRKLNEKAVNQEADAIIYEINSGGGAVVASKELMREIESVEVPTVCRFRDVAASGAYLASLGCDHIMSDSSSLTGSIGVKASYLEYSGLLEKLGIDYVNISAGKYKDTGTRYRNITDEEKKLLTRKTGKVHEDFVSTVEKKRNLSDSQVSQVTTGDVFLGVEALELGLVDSLGGREKAIETAENMTGTDLKTFRVERTEPFNVVEFFLSSLEFSLDSKNSPLMAVY